ncbi:MAG: hypothetical protein ACTIJT_05830, partial [Mesonia sp.]
IIKKGISSVKPELKPQVIFSETEALTQAIKNAKKDALIVLFCDDVLAATQVVKDLKNQEENNVDR